MNGYVSKIPGIILVAFFLLIQPATGSEKAFVIKMATLAPEGSSWMKTFHALNGEVMKETGNSVQFRIYPGGVLGDEPDVLRKININQIQGAALTSSGLSSIFKEIDVLQVPFLYQTYEEIDYTISKMDSFFRKGFEENGYVLLGWSEVGFIHLMSTTPIASLADLKKAKVWIWEESPMAAAIFNEAGVSAIPLSAPDVMVGLQTGMVDVVYAPPTVAISLQWFTKVKYITDVPLAYLAWGIIVRKDAFNKIPQKFQDPIMEIFQRHLDELKMVTRKENQEAIQVMMGQGVKMITPSKEQIDEFKRLSAKAMNRVIGQAFSKKSLEDVTSILESYRKGRK